MQTSVDAVHQLFIAITGMHVWMQIHALATGKYLSKHSESWITVPKFYYFSFPVALHMFCSAVL